ncbi:polysaccharide deacetylase family protein [Bradyrhizobium lablabi]|nr:polysaccharide deacetylase family protein [Bradyrhizobium lablabi]MBR0698074.1 polysaccharide deacetylase family protein [Bradyrhizobium lablabi]
MFVAIAVASLASSALAVECPRADALGTSRVLAVDPSAYPRVGVKSFPQTLPLEDHEVVLTFDDGPQPANDRKVLAALSAECVRATFFMVGRPALEHPELVRKIADLGHTIGHHTWTHANLKDLPPDKAEAEIDKGISAIEKVLHGKASATPSTPFFRFPYFDSTPQLLDNLEKRGIAVFGADFWASDWDKMTPDQQLKLLIRRLEAARKGIILLHDTKDQTAAMLPPFLRYLREHHYRVVHLVPAGPRTAAAGRGLDYGPLRRHSWRRT